MKIRYLLALFLSSATLFSSLPPQGGGDEPMDMRDIAAALDTISESPRAASDLAFATKDPFEEASLGVRAITQDAAKQIITQIRKYGDTPSLEAFLQFSRDLESFCASRHTVFIVEDTMLTYGNAIMHELLCLIMRYDIDDRGILTAALCRFYNAQQRLYAEKSCYQPFGLDATLLRRIYPIVETNHSKAILLEEVIKTLNLIHQLIFTTPE